MRDHGVEVLAAQLAVRPGAARTARRARPRRRSRCRPTRIRPRSAAPARRAARRAGRWRRARRGAPRGTSAAHSTRSSRDVGKDAPLGQCRAIVWPDRPTRCSSVAIRCGDPIWQTRSTCPMSMPSSSDAVATSARRLPALEPRFGVEPRLLRQAAVMRGHRLVAEPLAEMPRQALGHPPRVDEHQRRAVLRRRARRGGRSTRSHTSCDITASSSERGISIARSIGRACPSSTIVHGGAVGARQPARHLVDRLLRRRQPDALQRPLRHPLPAARATAPGARRAACRSRRGSRRRSRCAPCAASAGCAPR